jgi:polysaccharide export outer membrane protein
MAAANDADVTHVDLNALQNGALDKNVVLQDGDTVFVPRAASVYVFGEVKNPNAYPLQRNTTVMQAVTLAGGPTPDAAMNRITIVRSVNGTTTEVKVKDPQTDLVESGDTVKVPTRWF